MSPAAPSPDAVRAWFDTHSFRGTPRIEDLAELRAASGTTVSCVLPSLNEADTIVSIITTIREELLGPVVDEIVVVDGGSADGTVDAAREAGATVHFTGDIMPELPMWPGKGEAMWRSLAATTGDLVVWIDADIRNFHAGFVTALLAPLLDASPQAGRIDFVKAFYTRPLRSGDQMLPGEGGRVTELLARPLASALFPELTGFLQPLSGEYAGRREALEAVPFFSGYAVEIGLLLDLISSVGLDRMAQADLGERVHRNRSLRDLGPMSAAIARAMLKRAGEWGRIDPHVELDGPPYVYPDGDGGLAERRIADPERPPMATVSGKMPRP